MITDLNVYLRMLLMGGYVMSLPLGSVQVLHHASLPFLFALAFGCYKLYDMLTHHKGISIKAEVYVVLVTFLYLIVAEWFLHEGTIVNIYFISFGLNCGMLMLLADEFDRDSVVRERVMRLYVVSMVAVAMSVTFSVGTTASQTGRLTFLGLNQNDLAAALLVAYCWLSTEFMRSKLKLTVTRVVLLLSSIAVLNVIIVTGTRFALIGVIVVVLLLVFSASVDRSKVRNTLIYILISGVFISYKVMSFAPMMDRLVPANLGNNLFDLGGRLLLWRYAFDAHKESPFFGLGYVGYEKFVLMRERFFELPHNFPFEILAIAGVVGIILITSVGFILFWRTFVVGDLMNLPDALIWSTPVFFIMCFLNIPYYKVFWFVLAYFMTLDFGKRNKTAATECTS